MPDQQQERPYGSPLLDEIHNFFPALLYDTEQFRTVPHVFNYLNRQMRRRFDTFSTAREIYRRENPRRRATAQQPENQIEAANTNPVITPPPRQRRQSPPLIVRSVTERSSDPLEQFIQSLVNPTTNVSYQEQMLNMLSSFDSAINQPVATFEIPILTGITNQNFLDAVPVHPTQAQINEATTIVSITSEINPEERCAVCQESFIEGSESRIINYCRHQFHRRCVDRWFQQHVQCPVCRYDIRGID